jgi:lactoylglutathione lyase
VKVLEVEAVNHVGIRVRDKARAIDFYGALGFELISDVGFEAGHPVILRHAASEVVLNLLGPADSADTANVLMDIDVKHAGYTHVALTVSSLDRTREFLAARGIEITGSFEFGTMSAIFIRDPDRNVIELDAYSGTDAADVGVGYTRHP